MNPFAVVGIKPVRRNMWKIARGSAYPMIVLQQFKAVMMDVEHRI